MSEDELMIEMVRKSYVIFAPRSGRDLRQLYPELNEYGELGKLSKQDLLFVWYYACASSPLISMAPEKRMPAAVDVVYTETQRPLRLAEFKDLDFPANIKTAIRRMETFNIGSRVQAHEVNIHLMTQCRKILMKDVDDLPPSEKEQYLKDAVTARKLMREIGTDIERGSYGVDHEETSESNALKGLTRAFHKNRA